MTANVYQKLASRTLIDAPEDAITSAETMLVWNALGLTGEAGEVADLIKKAIFHRHGLEDATRAKLKKELGDVCWYVAAVCSGLGFTLEDVMQGNIDKLQERYPEGFTSEASKNR